MKDEELADELIKRLNRLIEKPTIRQDIDALMRNKVSVAPDTAIHPTIQVDGGFLGFLGLLNGAVGVMGVGPRKDWGFICAEYADDGQLLRFVRTQGIVAGAVVWYTDPEGKLTKLRGLTGTVRSVEGPVAMVEYPDGETCTLKDFCLPLKDLRLHVPA